MKSLFVILLVAVLSPLALASSVLKCSNRASDPSEVIGLRAERESSSRDFHNVQLYFQSASLVYPLAKYDDSYSPIGNHPVEMSRYRIYKTNHSRARLAILLPKVMPTSSNKLVRSYLVCENCGYHTENEYYRMNCKLQRNN